MEQVIHRAENLTQQVYRYVKEAILNGDIASGERVVESKLASDLHVSRSPIREAMRLLIAEQMLEERDGSVHVIHPTFEDLQELYELRISLETTMARSAAARITEKELHRFEENLAKTVSIVEAGQLEALPEVNAEFHGIVWEAAGNQRILTILRNVSTLINYYCFLIFKINRSKTNIVAEHQAIYEAIRQGDGTAAYDSMQTHVARDLGVIHEAFKKERGI